MTQVIETVWIPLPDGTHLAARLWMPDGDGPWPAILEYIPYRRRDRTRLRDESMHPHFADAGYAAIRVDIRGSGDSEGVMRDEYSEAEMQDGVDVIAWMAEQDWCDGNVGMFGKSWGAYNAFQVAARRPPALKAIAPVMGCDDRWWEDIHFYGGCLANDNFWWGSIMQLYNAMPPDPEIVGEDRWRSMWRERLEAMEFWPAMWLEHQTKDEMWKRGSISADYNAINVPVYFFGGWADLFRDTPFRIAENLSAPVKVLMGPWAHLYPHEAVPGPRIDFKAELIRFWDHHLKGIDTGLMDEPRLRFWMQDSVAPSGSHKQRPGRWIEAEAWPSQDVAQETLALNADGLSWPPDTSGDAMSICSPQTFGSAGGDMCSFAIPGDMPSDCRIDAGGALSYRGPVLEAQKDLLSNSRLSLTVSADKPHGIVAALLIDEAPDGAQTLITRAFLNLAQCDWGQGWRDEAPKPATPGEDMTLDLTFHGIGYCVAAGHRLVVQIASAYWPILWPAPEPVTLTLKPGASTLSLSVLRATDAPAPRALPEPARARTKRPVTRLRDGSMERSLHTDLMTGEHVSRFFLDGGVFGPVGRMRLDDTGTEMGDISDRVYRIHAEDPLTAKATMDQESLFERGDWKVRIETKAEMTATASDFHLKASTTCWDGETQFHHVEWDHLIPRRGM